MDEKFCSISLAILSLTNFVTEGFTLKVSLHLLVFCVIPSDALQ